MSAIFARFAALAALLLLLVNPVVSYQRDVTTWNTTECGVSTDEPVTAFQLRNEN